MLYLAIDQHRKQLTVNLRDEDAQVLVQRQVSTRWQAVREFLAGIQARGRQAGGWMVIREICGFKDWLLKLVAEYGAGEIVLLHPEERLRQKTDRRDANRLGELLWLNRHRLAAGRLPPRSKGIIPWQLSVGSKITELTGLAALSSGSKKTTEAAREQRARRGRSLSDEKNQEDLLTAETLSGILQTFSWPCQNGHFRHFRSNSW